MRRHSQFFLNAVLCILLVACGSPGSGTGTDDRTPPSPPPAGPGSVEPFVVKGRLTNSAGDPIAGAEVFLNFTLGYNRNLLTTSDADGHYRFDLAGIPGNSTWRVGAEVKGSFDGQEYHFTVHPADDSSITAAGGAVRDIVAELTGNVEVYPDLDLQLPLNMELLVLELSPVKLLDGTPGTPLRVRPEYGTTVRNVGIGTWTASAYLEAPDGDRLPLLIRPAYTGTYAAGTTASFQSISSYEWILKLEVTVPDSILDALQSRFIRPGPHGPGRLSVSSGTGFMRSGPHQLRN